MYENNAYIYEPALLCVKSKDTNYLTYLASLGRLAPYFERA